MQSDLSVAENQCVTPPRQVLPAQTIFLTCRAVGRSFRFVPTRKAVETLRFCFFYTVSKFNVAIHEFVWMSNHFHIVMTMADARLPDFMQQFNSLCARALNALRGWSGSNIEKGYNFVVDLDDDTILQHCAYTLANPCAADLVTRARNWKGLTSVGLEYGQEVTVERPNYGLWASKCLMGPAANSKSGKGRSVRDAGGGRTVVPEQVTFSLTPPPLARGDMTDVDVRAEVRRRVAQLEEEAEAARVKAGKRVLGMRRAREQRWFDIPREREAMFGKEPKVAGRSKWARLEAAQRSCAFRQAYEIARDAWISGQRDVLFPFGTWLMRRRFGVRCATSPPT
jgi:putative transposase